MRTARSVRYSIFIRPISIFTDLLVISSLALLFFKGLNLNYGTYIGYLIISWGTIAFFIKFYDVFRFTTPVEILTKIVKQGVLFSLLIIAFFPFSKEVIFSGNALLRYILLSFILITVSKFLLFYYLKKYRIITGSNYRNIVIIGFTTESIRLKELFEARNDYGYRFLGYFSNKKKKAEILGDIEYLKTFVIDNQVNEIYCTLDEMTNDQLADIVQFSDENKIEIKFIPGSKEIYSKKLKINYYEMFPVLSMQKTVLHDPATKLVKRIFDIIFSLIIIVFILSWFVPLLSLLIKLESKGPVFFKQGRPGLDEKEFFCYKFRSMKLNETTEKEASKNDPRVTKIGRIIRKTSVDELPQFINVFLGDMSVVGPRPHLWSQNKSYGKKINKYMVRHYIKPGITGLAQVKGFRGEIESDEDMRCRIKLDVFYIDNWSLILDIKIIVQTVLNIMQGEKKAY
ncbi:putative UDP-glucose lipid carrier transferase [Flavobacteriaceae bacterium]